MRRLVVTGFIFFSLLTFGQSRLQSVGTIPSAGLKIMSWNVENLFDPEHDDGTNDFEYLPKAHPLKKSGCEEKIHEKYREKCLSTDWTRAKLLLKYQQIKKMVDSVGARPDVLALVEIENEKVLRELGAILGYKRFAITQTDDERGVDLGMLFNEKPGFKFLGSRDIAIPLPSLTRPILQAAFDYNGSRVDIYVNHWPATGAPSEQRVVAATALRQAIEQTNSASRSQGIYSVALGDFNVTADNRPYAFDVLQDKQWGQALYDLDQVARQYVQIPVPGTYFYGFKMQWNLFDRIFLSKNFFEQKSLKLPVNRYQIVTNFSGRYVSRPDPVTGKSQTVNQVPIRYNPDTTDAEKAGFSDHFPVLFEILPGQAR